MQRWRHKKRGSCYTEIGKGLVQANGVVREGAEVMIYRGDDGRLWVRPMHEFVDGRFERLDDNKDQLKLALTAYDRDHGAWQCCGMIHSWEVDTCPLCRTNQGRFGGQAAR